MPESNALIAKVSRFLLFQADTKNMPKHTYWDANGAPHFEICVIDLHSLTALIQISYQDVPDSGREGILEWIDKSGQMHTLEWIKPAEVENINTVRLIREFMSMKQPDQIAQHWWGEKLDFCKCLEQSFDEIKCLKLCGGSDHRAPDGDISRFQWRDVHGQINQLSWMTPKELGE